MSNKGLTFIVMGALLALCMALASCSQEAPAPAPAPVPAPVVAPPPPPPVTPPPPPATPLTPILDTDTDTAASASAGKGGVKGVKDNGDVDSPIAGVKTSGDELVGNYRCRLEVTDLPIGPIKVPEYGCRIYRDDAGALKIGPTTRSVVAINGAIADPGVNGFFVVGTYSFPGNKLDVKVRMKRQGKDYAGSGRGTLNGDKNLQKNYKFSMTRL